MDRLGNDKDDEEEDEGFVFRGDDFIFDGFYWKIILTKCFLISNMYIQEEILPSLSLSHQYFRGLLPPLTDPPLHLNPCSIASNSLFLALLDEDEAADVVEDEDDDANANADAVDSKRTGDENGESSICKSPLEVDADADAVD